LIKDPLISRTLPLVENYTAASGNSLSVNAWGGIEPAAPRGAPDFSLNQTRVIYDETLKSQTIPRILCHSKTVKHDDRFRPPEPIDFQEVSPTPYFTIITQPMKRTHEGGCSNPQIVPGTSECVAISGIPV
jgi:hypothetical protein